MATGTQIHGKVQFFDLNGNCLSGGKVYVYAAGTTTNKTSYTIPACTGGSENTQPVNLDSRGEANIYVLGDCKIKVQDFTSADVYTLDNVQDINATITATITAKGVEILATLAAPNGSNLSGYLPAGTGGVATTVQWKLRESVSVKDFGAVGDGVTNDTTAIQSAITSAGVNGTLYFNAGTYLCTSKLTMLSGQKFIGLGGHLATTIKKGGNIDQLEMVSQCHLIGINFEGVGASYTGRGIVVISGFNQLISDCRVAASKGVALEFSQDAGGGCNVRNFVGDTIDNLTVPAINLVGDLAPHPRFFTGIWLSGCAFGIGNTGGAGAGNGCSISNFYIGNILITGTTLATGMVLMHWNNGRVASIAATTTLIGNSCDFSNIAFSGPVALNNAQGINLSNTCTFGAGITEDSTTCSYNSFYTSNNTYVATWDQASGTQPALVDGTLTSWYIRSGRECSVSIRMVLGASSTMGNSATQYRWALPYLSSSSLNQNIQSGLIVDVSTTTDYMINCAIGLNEQVVKLSRNETGIKLDTPFIYAVNDKFQLNFSYFVK
jgi:hypothetical protein